MNSQDEPKNVHSYVFAYALPKHRTCNKPLELCDVYHKKARIMYVT